MDISETWKKLETERLSRPIEFGTTRKQHSKHPVAQLKHNYFIKGLMMLFFIVCFTVLLFTFDLFIIQCLMTVLIVAYGVFMFMSFFMYKTIREDLPMDRSLIEVLTHTKHHIEKALRFETRSGLLIFPFAGAAGYFIGYTTSGHDIMKIFDTTSSTGIFAATIVGGMILSYFLGKKLTGIGYRKSLTEIGKLIDELKAV